MQITPEILNAAAKCKSTDELISFAHSRGADLSVAEAEKYLVILADRELTENDMNKVTGGLQKGSAFCVGNVCNSNFSCVGNVCDQNLGCISNC